MSQEANNSKLELGFGDVLQLQFLPDEDHKRHYVRVIGYLPDHSIMVTTPQLHGKVMLVKEEQSVAVRTMSGVNIIAFTGSVLRSCARPYPYLHISYPTDLQTLALRKAKRVPLDASARIRECTGHDDKDANETLEVNIVDISTSGALFRSTKPIGHIKSLISVHIDMRVAGGEESFATLAIIRNVRKRKNDAGENEFLYGVEFKIADRQDEILLHAFTNERIVNG